MLFWEWHQCYSLITIPLFLLIFGHFNCVSFFYFEYSYCGQHQQLFNVQHCDPRVLTWVLQASSFSLHCCRGWEHSLSIPVSAPLMLDYKHRGKVSASWVLSLIAWLLKHGSAETGSYRIWSSLTSSWLKGWLFTKCSMESLFWLMQS